MHWSSADRVRAEEFWKKRAVICIDDQSTVPVNIYGVCQQRLTGQEFRRGIEGDG